MLLDLGQEVAVKEEAVVGIFDLDTTTITQKGRLYLSNKEKRGKIVSTTKKIPKSFVLCSENNDEKIYISKFATSTFLKRSLLDCGKNIDG